MPLTIVACKNRKCFQDFLEVPFILHQKNPNWVPPLRTTTARILNKKNPFFQNANIQLWVAYLNKKPIGRIGCIINNTHNKFYNEKTGFWGFLETTNSDEVTSLLFSQAEQWANQQGIHTLRGPMNPSINYECGLQISAFDTKPFFMMTQNPEYYPTLVENQQYKKIKDLQAWIFERKNSNIEPRKMEIIKEIQTEYNISIRPLNIKNLTEELKLIVNIYNDAWSNNWGYLPLDLNELNYLISDLKLLLFPNFIYIAEINDEPCGFSIELPDLNQLLLKIRSGRLLPFNFLKLFWQIKVQKSITQGRIPLLGVLNKYRHIPIGVMLYFEYLTNCKAPKYSQAECSWILEDNEAMQAGLKLVNAKHYKTYRIYEKSLQPTDSI